MPAPTPRMQLMTMSHAMLRANRQATPLKKKIESPTIRILSLSLPSESFPESSTKGMISSDGSEVSIWISRSVTLGNTLFRSPRIGETASPGSDAMADTDQIASSTTSVMEPFPVLIFMSGILVPLSPQLLYQTKTDRPQGRPAVRFLPQYPLPARKGTVSFDQVRCATRSRIERTAPLSECALFYI